MMEKTEIRYAEIETRAIEGRKVSGYAAVFNQWSRPFFGYFRERIDPKAFSKTDYSDTVACFNHDVDKVLARTSSETLKLSIDDIGLRFEFDMPDTTVGNDLLELVKRGDISQCSFAFTVKDEKWETSKEEGVKEDRTIMDIDNLYDVSLVTRPAYPQTTVDIKKRSLELEQKNEEPIYNTYYAELMLGLR